VITQIPPNDIHLPPGDQRHEPLAFASGTFSGAASHWSMLEKEAFPIVAAIDKFDYLLIRERGFHIYTDHRNLVFLFDPLLFSPNLKRHTLDKIQRWALRLSGLRYTIQHIPGESNVWADLLTRWGVPQQVSVRAFSFRLYRSSIDADSDACRLTDNSSEIHLPNLASDEFRPSESEIITLQSEASTEPSINVGSEYFDREQSGLFQSASGVIWIPDTAINLIRRLLVIAHQGSAGHRAASATRLALSSRFYWSSLASDVSSFISRCHHCIINANGSIVPRPFGEAVHSNTPNVVIHFDYLSIGLAENGFRYLFVIRDDLSGYVDLFPCTSADHANAIDALLDWFSRFGVALVWVSDQGSHFKNRLVDALRFRLQANHHFVLAYTPWANGTVEVINRSILSVFRRMISEFRLEFRDWPYLVPIIRYVLNHTVTQSRPIAPVTAFTCLPPSSPLDAIRIPRLDELVPVQVSSETLQSRVEVLRDSLASMHRSIVSNRNGRREQSNRFRDTLPNFVSGDFVLVAVPTSSSNSYRHKLQVRWTGPFRIVDCLSDYVYLVENLITEERQE
jgi:transposase InsO family protein